MNGFRQQRGIDVIVIGASAGGVSALSAILPLFPTTCPGIVIVQHMPAGFTQRFAERLNMLSKIRVMEAEDGERILPGQVLLAPGTDYHTIVDICQGEMCVRLQAGEKVSGHKPSVDMLFLSAARAVRERAAAVLLTGMGSDGTAGMLAVRRAGGRTFAQDEKSSIVFGMPGSAWQKGAVEELLPLEDIPARLMSSQ